MIKSVTVTNYLGESLEILLADPYNTGLAITEITGLGPAKANIYKTDLATTDGSIYNSSRMDERNIVITIRPLPVMNDYRLDSVEKVRYQIYRYFPIKKKVTLKFVTDNRTVTIDGFVETNEAKIFSDKEEVQISIICPNPWFVGDGIDTARFSTIRNDFSFPFANVVTAEDPQLRTLSLSTYQINNVRNIYYSGDDETGMVISAHFTGPATGYKITDIITGEFISVDDAKIKSITKAGISKGDEIRISTKRGERYIQLIRNGTVHNILNALNMKSTWLMLTHGDNQYTYKTNDGISNITVTIDADILYGGI